MSIKIRQRDFSDCGPACVASIASYYNLHASIFKIRELASTNEKGTSIFGVVESLKSLGFEAKGVKGTIPSLSFIPTPAIAHLITCDSLHHFVVINKVSENFIQIMNPDDGEFHRIKREDFGLSWTGALIIAEPGPNFKKTLKITSVASRLWQLLLPYKYNMLKILLGSLVYTILGLCGSIYIQKVIDETLIQPNRTLLHLMGLMMIFVIILQVLVSILKNILISKTASQIDQKIIITYYTHLLSLPLKFFDSMKTGEIVSRINDAVKIRSFINEAVASIGLNIFITIFSVCLMFSYYWKLAFIAFLVTPFYSLIYFFADRLNNKFERKLMEHSAKFESSIIESICSIRTIKEFSLEEFTREKTEVKLSSLLNVVYKSGLHQIYTGGSAEFISKLFTIIVLWIGAVFVLDVKITAGELLSFYALIAYFTGPLSSLIGLNKIIQGANVSTDRLFEIMDLEKEPNTLFPKTDEKIGDGEIYFRDISFKYNYSSNVFEDLNLKIPMGKLTSIVGESGSGKSTLVSLLLKLYPLISGHILIDNTDIASISNSSIREIISVVPQKIDIFSGTIIENIAIGNSRIDLPKLTKICDSLGLTKFIEKLPYGFNTQLGENGTTLSGGQKQRIGIARALYKDHKILVMDEATSALDSISEKYIQDTIAQLRSQNKTIILITHRLSSVMDSDNIIVLQRGVVSEEGTHSDLLRAKGAYYSLWTQQFPYYSDVQI